MGLIVLGGTIKPLLSPKEQYQLFCPLKGIKITRYFQLLSSFSKKFKLSNIDSQPAFERCRVTVAELIEDPNQSLEISINVLFCNFPRIAIDCLYVQFEEIKSIKDKMLGKEDTQ